MYSMNKDGKVKWIPIEAQETEKRELPVDNIVRQLYVVQQICGQTYTDLHPFYEHINDAVKYMNDLKAQMNSKFRVIKRLEFLVA